MKLTTKGAYALRAILDLVKNSAGNPVRLQEISERQEISLHYLEQLFRKLRQSTVVTSVRGPGGGYVLAREASAVTVGDILSGVGEKLSYAAASSSAATEESAKVSTFLATLDASVQEKLSTPISELTTNA